MSIEIADRTVGPGEPVFIIAEVGVNHNGEIGLAKVLIDMAAEAGADAVKFQTFNSEELVSKEASASQLNLLKKLELSRADFLCLKEYCEDKGIIFLSTPFDEQSVHFLLELGVPAIKVGSGELTNLPLLETVAQAKLPIILSTGMSSLAEVEEAVHTLLQAGNNTLVLMHCVSCYPADIEDANLRAIKTLAQTFGLPVGYSDHTLGIEASLAAVALGACVIEKHFTLNKNLAGPDQHASLEPDELQALVKGIRRVEKALGNGIKKPAPAELQVRQMARKSLVARTDIPKGTIIRRDMVALKRPGTGISPGFLDLVVGRQAKTDIKADALIAWENI